MIENREAIILLGHGSRAPEAGRDMEKIAEALKGQHRHALVAVAYMSLCEPLYPAAFARCVQQGARRVIVIPYFLHLGNHIREDIPRILAEEARKFPGVAVVLGLNLGYDETLVALVEKRIQESKNLPAIKS